RRAAGGGIPRAERAPGRQHRRDQAAPGAPARRDRPDHLRPHAPAADDPAGRDRNMTELAVAHWSQALRRPGIEDATVIRLSAQLTACEVAALSFCRLLERWARGDAEPCTPGRRQAALRHAAERAETALSGLDRPLGRYLLELDPE